MPFPKPEGYDPEQYELLLRVFEAGWRETFDKFDPIPNRKTDTNNHGPFSTDNIGCNYDYPEASYERRREIIQEHETYQKGCCTSWPTTRACRRTSGRRWRSGGWPKDEFTDNGNWPHQIYVREARRMVGRYVMTENELLEEAADARVGRHGLLHAWTPTTSSATSRPKATCRTRATSASAPTGPTRSPTARSCRRRASARTCWCRSASRSSHIAYGSIRMEPVFMILGQSAATAAVMALDGGIPVQEVPYEKLRERLLADGQVLEMRATSRP